MPVHKIGMPIFTDSAIHANNRLPQQRPLSDREKVELIMPIHMYTDPENLVKIGPVNF